MLILLAAFLCACASWGRDKNLPLVAAVNPPIADVPVPVGFTMTPDSTSKITPGDASRLVDHRYKGNEDVLPVVRFYRDKLPDKGWTWVDQTQSQGNEITLHYTKGSETLTVTVSPGSWGNTFIRVKIDPATKK
jgi:hypothetical protein